MKSFRRLSLGYFVALAAMALLSVQEASAMANKAIVRAVRTGEGGSVQISSDKGKSWKPAKVGNPLGADSLIKTSAGASADLFLGENGPVVRVQPDSQLGIDKLDVEATGIEKVIDTELNLKSGKILGSVKKMAAASKYEVKTPVGVAGIRGTEYAIDARGNINVVTGTVVVVYIVGNQVLPPQTVGAGQSASPPINANTPVTLGSVNVTETAGVPTLTVNITVNPNGTITDNTLNITTTPGGGNPLSGTTTGTTGTTGTTTTTTTVGPAPTTTSTTANFDVTNDTDLNKDMTKDHPLSEDQPEIVISNSNPT